MRLGERGERGVDVGQVGGIRALRWGVPTQMKCTSPNSAASSKTGREAQSTGGERGGELLGQSGLEERHLAR